MGATASNSRYAGKGGKPPKNGSEWRGFVNIELTDDDVERFSSEDWTMDECMAVLVIWHESGYKFSCSPDPAHQCTIVTVTGKEFADFNGGYSLSARGPGLVPAMKALWYKTHVLCKDESWIAFEDASQRRAYG